MPDFSSYIKYALHKCYVDFIEHFFFMLNSTSNILPAIMNGERKCNITVYELLLFSQVTFLFLEFFLAKIQAWEFGKAIMKINLFCSLFLSIDMVPNANG